MAEEIELDETQEAALEKAWEKLEQEQPKKGEEKTDVKDIRRKYLPSSQR